AQFENRIANLNNAINNRHFKPERDETRIALRNSVLGLETPLTGLKEKVQKGIATYFNGEIDKIDSGLYDLTRTLPLLKDNKGYRTDCDKVESGKNKLQDDLNNIGKLIAQTSS